jgi:hypothetical protein
LLSIIIPIKYSWICPVKRRRKRRRRRRRKVIKMKSLRWLYLKSWKNKLKLLVN